MKKFFAMLMVAALLASLCALTVNAEVSEEEWNAFGEVTAQYKEDLASVITLDGDVSDWQANGFQRYDIDCYNLRSFVGEVDENWSINLWFSADTEFLYIAFKINDPVVTYNGVKYVLTNDYGTFYRDNATYGIIAYCYGQSYVATVSTVQELVDAINAGATVIDANGAEVGCGMALTTAQVPAGKTVTIKNAVFTPGANYGNKVDGTVIFENCTFDGDVYSIHFDGGTGKVVFNNCILTGWCSFESVEVEMNNCNISGNGKYALIRCYKNATFTNCTFDLSDCDRTDKYADRIDCGSANPTNTITLIGCTNVNGEMADIVPASVVAMGAIIIK